MIRFLPLLMIMTATPALADPCTAPVSGYSSGTVITGTIRYVGDGDSLCIGRTPDPRTWLEVRLHGWSAPELNEPGGKRARAALERLRGLPAVCTVRRGRNGRTASYDRVIASCSVAGVPVAERMRRAGVREGGR